MSELYETAARHLLADDWDEVQDYAPEHGDDPTDWAVTAGQDGILVKVSANDDETATVHVESMKTHEGVNVYARAHSLAQDCGLTTGLFDRRIEHNADPESIEQFFEDGESVEWNVHTEFTIESVGEIDRVHEAVDDVRSVKENVEAVHTDAFAP